MEQLPARDYEGNVTDGEEAEDLEAAEEEVNTHTCVPDLDLDENERSRAAQAVVNFPARGGDPISDAYPDFFTKAYPVLFPNGDADFNARGTGRLVKVTLREWAAHLLRLADIVRQPPFVKRFDNNPRFRFTVYNRFIRQRALQVTQAIRSAKNEGFTQVFVKQQGLSSDYTIAQLLQAVRSNDLTIIQPDPTASAKDRNKFINDNPSTCVSVFIERFRILLDSFLLPDWGLKDYFWIVEYQHRGSIHIHGLAWQDHHQVQQYDHSKLHQHLSQGAGHEVEDAVEFFDHYISAWNDCKLRSDEVRRALEGDDTVNPDPVPRGYSKPEVHPSTLLYNPSTTTDDLTACLMAFQRHTICKRTTCLRTKRGSLQCRMLFPKPLRETSGLGQEEGRSDGSLSFIPRRNANGGSV
ncbi:hypothetical protein FOZ60_008817 [Perkinsus olseni]|uniref:Helitron helicase-like domain-containing protein n=1 Tax=Perkinsus olseni TaxID=32597 RepID=A0A7J6NIC1_PEROL|nr:hypothetical protein FOZ60_008817 [Perkinsus olseni]